jgi:HSP20 family protein
MYRQQNRAEGPQEGDTAFGRGRHGHGHDSHHGPYGQQGPFGPKGQRHSFDERRAPVSIYKTDTTYEVLVFAPGRIKENFKVTLNGTQLVISYQPTEDTFHLNWVRKEYSRGAFERTFQVDDTIETGDIQARYENGVLILSLRIKPGSQVAPQEVPVI